MLRRRLALVAISTAQLLTALDATVINIALPSAQRSLGFGDAHRQWVVTAYTVCFGGLLLLGGRLADVLGRRLTFMIGLAGFGFASLLAGSAVDFTMLLTGRAMQGAFAALIAPAALSLLAVTFSEPLDRARAFAVYGVVASSGAAAGLVLGGVLTEYLSWRSCLFMTAGVAAVAVAMAVFVLPETPRFTEGGIDGVSASLTTAGLAAVVFGSSQAAIHGWSSPIVVASLATGVIVLGILAGRQSRTSSPMVPLRVLADRGRAGAYLAVATAVVGSFSMFLMLTYYLQVVLAYSPVSAGLAVLPLTLANSLSGYQLGKRLMSRIAPRLLIAAGLLVAGSGLALLTRLTPTTGYLRGVLPALVLVGLGMGSVFPAAFQLAIRGVAPCDAGVASALANVATQVGSSIGTAVLNTIAVNATTAYLATVRSRNVHRAAALVHGYVTAIGWSAGLLTAAAMAVLVIVNTPRPDAAKEAT